MKSKTNTTKTLLVLLVAIFIICILIFQLNKGACRKAELNDLLQEKDISGQILIDNKAEVQTGATYDSLNSQEEYTLVDESVSNNKKSNHGKDYIKDAETAAKSQGKKNANIVISDGNSINHTDSDVNTLARLIYSEAGNQPYSGQLAVANVVVNRMKVENLSLSQVINQENQFDGIKTKYFYTQPSTQSVQVAEDILSGKNIMNNAYYFANLKLCSPAWATKERFICRIGDHWFFKK